MSELAFRSEGDRGRAPSRNRPWLPEYAGDAEEPAPFDLRNTIDAVAADLVGRHGDGDLTLQLRYPLGVPRFLIGHEDRVRRVMRKLLGHAAELATVRGSPGRVVIDVQGDGCADGCAAMRLRLEVAGRGADGGSLGGELPAASLGQGRGELGLIAAVADCRRLVELMGGRLGALNDPGCGSFVWLAMKLPVDASRPRGWEPR